MGSLSVWHWLIFLVVALLMFGRERQNLLDHGRCRQGYQKLQEGHVGGRRRDREARGAQVDRPAGRQARRELDRPAR